MTVELISETGEKAFVRVSGDEISVTFEGSEVTVNIDRSDSSEGLITFGQRTRRFFAHRRGDGVDVWLDGEIYRINKASPASQTDIRPVPSSGEVTASMPGMVVRVMVSEGDSVAPGDGIVVLESMKMQLTLAAPHSGTVKALKAIQGTMVEQGAVLARIEPEPPI